MARKDGTPRVTPDLASELLGSLRQKRAQQDTDVLIGRSDQYVITVDREHQLVKLSIFHPISDIPTTVVLSETDADQLAQHMLDAREDIRR